LDRAGSIADAIFLSHCDFAKRIATGSANMSQPRFTVDGPLLPVKLELELV